MTDRADSSEVSSFSRKIDPTSGPTRAGYRWALALLLLIPVFKAVVADSIDPDFFWHVRVAEQLIERGIGPVPDTFSFMSKPGDWTPFSWLGELLMKFVFDAAGLPGIVGVHALCSVAFFAFIALACGEATRTFTGSQRRLATLICVAFAMCLSLAFLSFRPVTMALALLSAMGWLIWRDRSCPTGAFWLLVPATVVLTNLHLYVILWVAILWAITVGAWLDAKLLQRDLNRPRRLLKLTIACSLAALCTPMLPGCIRNAIWFNGQDPMVENALVAEIAPFYAGAFGKVMLLAMIALVAFAIRARRMLGFEHLAVLFASIAILLQMGRFATVFAIFACPIFAVALPQMRDVVLARRPLKLAMMVAALLIVGRCAIAFPRPSTTMDVWLTRNGDADSLHYPTAAAAFVERDVPRVNGRVFNELTWGGYLIWRLGDRYQVFMDGRTLIYTPEFWQATYVSSDEAGRDAIMRSQPADAAILPLTKSRLHDSLIRSGWHEAYADDRARVLVPPATIREARTLNDEIP
jgi:hypothetical protein